MKRHLAAIYGNTKNNYSWFVLTHRQGLLLNNYDVLEIDSKITPIERARDILISKKPRYIFTHLTFHNQGQQLNRLLSMYHEVTRKAGSKWVHTCNDARKEDRAKIPLYTVFFAAFVGSRDMVTNGRKVWRIPTYYSAYSSLKQDSIASPVNKFKFTTPVFTGNPIIHEDRSKFIKLLGERMELKIMKTQSKQDLRHQTPELSASAKCILGLCTGYDVPFYIDVRPWQYLGAGAFMIIRKFQGMDEIIPDNLYIPFTGYSKKDADFVVSKFREYSKIDTSAIRTRAFNFIQKYHNSQIRMRNILNVLEGKQDSTKCFLRELN